MADSLPLPPSVHGAQPAAALPSSRKSVASSDGANAFKALLDQLDERAKALEVESSKDLTKDDLAGAIDNARASLEQMLSLKDQLLEAWRAAQSSPDEGARPRS
jgi:hypothetical protein